ncbi:MAG: Asp23/Gls24 family envelope stress response protein [Fervidobacterium sp.]
MGNITVSDNVITEIAYRSICNIYGVDQNNKEFKRQRKNISIERTPEDNVVINLKLEIPYGENIIEFCKNIMKSVSENVTQMTDKVVEAVNVTVVNIFEKQVEDQQ